MNREGNEAGVRDLEVAEVMDAVEERAESTLQLLAVLESARMMQVTREAILESIEEEQRQERARFEALLRTDGREGETWQHMLERARWVRAAEA